MVLHLPLPQVPKRILVLRSHGIIQLVPLGSNLQERGLDGARARRLIVDTLALRLAKLVNTGAAETTPRVSAQVRAPADTAAAVGGPGVAATTLAAGKGPGEVEISRCAALAGARGEGAPGLAADSVSDVRARRAFSVAVWTGVLVQGHAHNAGQEAHQGNQGEEEFGLVEEHGAGFGICRS